MFVSIFGDPAGDGDGIGIFIGMLSPGEACGLGEAPGICIPGMCIYGVDCGEGTVVTGGGVFCVVGTPIPGIFSI
jgi:hypothetical protein